MSETYNAAIATVDQGSIESMTPQEAGQKLAELSAVYRGDVPIAEVMKSAPSDAVGAARKLQGLMANKEWRDMFDRGHPGARKDFETLTTMVAGGTEADLAVAGIMPEQHLHIGPGASLQDQISAAADMRARGLTAAGVREWLIRDGIDPATMSNEKAIHSILSDKKPSLQTHELGKQELDRLKSDRDFQEQLDRGVPWARTHFLVVNWAVGCYDGT